MSSPVGVTRFGGAQAPEKGLESGLTPLQGRGGVRSSPV